MNITDAAIIRHQIQTAQHHLGKLSTLATIYQEGRVVIIDEDLPLTAAQKQGIKDMFNALMARMRKAADRLEERTGKTGIVDEQTLLRIQETPARISTLLDKVLHDTQDLEEMLSRTSSVGEDGQITPMELDDDSAQRAANVLATLRAAAKWWIQQEAAKLI